MATNANAKINAMSEAGLEAAEAGFCVVAGVFEVEGGTGVCVVEGETGVCVVEGEASEHSTFIDWAPGGGSVVMQSPGLPVKVSSALPAQLLFPL